MRSTFYVGFSLFPLMDTPILGVRWLVRVTGSTWYQSNLNLVAGFVWRLISFSLNSEKVKWPYFDSFDYYRAVLRGAHCAPVSLQQLACSERNSKFPGLDFRYFGVSVRGIDSNPSRGSTHSTCVPSKKAATRKKKVASHGPHNLDFSSSTKQSKAYSYRILSFPYRIESII